MSGCCLNESPSAPAVPPGGRMRELTRWLIPGAGLALIPKCPACLAAYFAVATGVGLSLPTAAYLRLALLLLCAGSLAYLVVRRLPTRWPPRLRHWSLRGLAG